MDNNSGIWLVGGRISQHFLFSGTIYNVVVFNSHLEVDMVQYINSTFSETLMSVGTCAPYLPLNSDCPTPSTSQSSLCSSIFDW